MTTASSPQYESEIDLDRYPRFVMEHWGVLAGCAAAGAAVALALAVLAPPRFEAAAMLTVLPPPPVATGLPGLTAAAAKALLSTPGLASDVVNQLGLAAEGVSATQLGEAVDLQPQAAPNTLRLSVVLRDPAHARAAAALIADKLVALSATATGAAASRVRASLEQPLADADRRLKDAEERLARFQAGAEVAVPATGSERSDLVNARPERPRRASPSGGPSSVQPDDAARRRFEFARVKAQYDERLKAYTALRESYEQVGSATAGHPQLEVAVPPVQPDRPLARKRVEPTILGGLLGLVCGIVVALASERRRAAHR